MIFAFQDVTADHQKQEGKNHAAAVDDIRASYSPAVTEEDRCKRPTYGRC